VRLDGLGRDEQLISRLPVGISPCDELQHLTLPIAEPVELGIDIGGVDGRERVQHEPRQPWGEHGVPGCDAPDGVDQIIELGGGIGPGETPAEKRPNLESIIKKAARAAGRDVEYLPAINLETIAAL